MPKTDHRKNLTPTMIKGLKPAPKGERYWIADSQVPGFGVRVTDTGHRTFALRIQYPGTSSKSRREIGPCSDISLADAREKARNWRSMVGQGIDPVVAEAAARAAVIKQQATTFGAVAEDFIREKLPGERKGIDVEREIRRDLLPVWRDLPIAGVTDAHVSFLIKRKGRDGKVGARNLLALVKRLFRWAMAQPEKEYGISMSPCASMRASDILGEMQTPATRILTNDELCALWRVASRMRYPDGAILQLLMLTGLRLNEVVEASWGEFNIREDVWVIPASRMKGKNSGKKQARPHAVPLTSEIMAVLEALPRFAGGKYLFSTTAGKTPIWFGTRNKDRVDRRMLRTLRALAKHRGENPADVTLPHFVTHDVRRTVRSQLSRLKVTEEAREAVLAHARPGIKGTYDLHNYMDEKREALGLWAGALKRIVAPGPQNVITLRVAS